ITKVMVTGPAHIRLSLEYPMLHSLCNHMLWRHLSRFAYLFFLCAISGFSQRPTEIYNSRAVAESRIIIKFRAPSAGRIGLFQQLLDADSVRQIGGADGPHLFHSRSRAVTAMINAAISQGDILYAEPDYLLHSAAAPNDPSYTSQWALRNSPAPGISAASAWSVSTGSAQNVVGLVDTGIDYTHPDLAANVWSAPSSFTVTLGYGTVTCPAGSHGYNAILH